jgi:hypothetical protein
MEEKEIRKIVSEAMQGMFMGGNDTQGGARGIAGGKTVNSIIDDMFNHPSAPQTPIKKPIEDHEALEICIKRTLNSGDPINNISFYDEINWNLAQLGFPSKSPMEIKEELKKLIK